MPSQSQQFSSSGDIPGSFLKCLQYKIFVNFLEGKCLSYSRGAPYHPVVDILKTNFDLHEGEQDWKNSTSFDLDGFQIDLWVKLA